MNRAQFRLIAAASLLVGAASHFSCVRWTVTDDPMLDRPENRAVRLVGMTSSHADPLLCAIHERHVAQRSRPTKARLEQPAPNTSRGSPGVQALPQSSVQDRATPHGSDTEAEVTDADVQRAARVLRSDEETLQRLEMMSFARETQDDPGLAAEARKAGIELDLAPDTVAKNIDRARDLYDQRQSKRASQANDDRLMLRVLTDPWFATTDHEHVDVRLELETLRRMEPWRLSSEGDRPLLEPALARVALSGALRDGAWVGVTLAPGADRNGALLFGLGVPTLALGFLGYLWLGRRSNHPAPEKERDARDR